MIALLLLTGSVATQALCIGATRASRGLHRPGWVVVAFLAMTVSVAFMAQAIERGLPLAVGYGIWSGAGIVAGAAIGVLVFGDRLARLHLFGLGAVALGVAVVYAGE